MVILKCRQQNNNSDIGTYTLKKKKDKLSEDTNLFIASYEYIHYTYITSLLYL